MPFQIHPETGEVTGFSFSGDEKNRLFMQVPGGHDFLETTLVSGVDFKEDGRCFALSDFNNDGFIDIGLISTGKPKFRLLENQYSQSRGSKDFKWLELMLVGGNTDAKSSRKWSPREPIGATVVVTTGNQKRRFQYSPFEGLTTQNSKWIHVGLGDETVVDEIEILWPSGKKSIRNDVEANSRLVIQENEE